MNLFVRPKEAAGMLGMTERWLQKLRYEGGGPSYVKLGNRVVYRPEDLRAWAEAQPTLASTSGPGRPQERLSAAQS